MKGKMLILCASIILGSCADDFNYMPKPKGYVRIALPEKVYVRDTTSIGASFELPNYAVRIDKPSTNDRMQFENIVFPKFKATVFCTYVKLDSTGILAHVQKAQESVYEHQVKASGIRETQFSNLETDVHGTTFDLEGNVACNYLFYLTDSTNHFYRGQMHLETAPNADSLEPILIFLKDDLQHMIETFEWK